LLFFFAAWNAMESYSTAEKAARWISWDKLQMAPPGKSGESGELVFKSVGAAEERMTEDRMGQYLLDDGATPLDDQCIVYFLYGRDFASKDSSENRVQRIGKFLEKSSGAKGRILDIIRKDRDKLIRINDYDDDTSRVPHVWSGAFSAYFFSATSTPLNSYVR
jgi:hypothetical protein